MTVIAWDGKTLAADRRATNGGALYSVTKLARLGDCLVGFSGGASQIGRYRAWLVGGRDPERYPVQAADDSCYMLVIHRSGLIERFESTGYPVVVEEDFHSMGSGRDFAMATMALGHDAVRAVEIASRFCECCGNGVDTLSFEAGPSGEPDAVP